MPWGKIDDAFDDDPRVLRVLAHSDGPQALGLWTLCFAWANRCTRRRGRVPGLLPYQLPVSKMGPQAYQWAEVLVDEDLWARADPDHIEAGWVIVDFVASLPNEELRRKRADAGRRGAERRWGRRPATDPPPAPTPPPTPAAEASPSSTGNPSDQGVPGVEEAFASPDAAGMANCHPSDGKSHILPMATSSLLSVCHPEDASSDGTLPSRDGTLPPFDGTLLSRLGGGDGAGAGSYGTLPPFDSTLLSPGSKLPPHTHTHTHALEKKTHSPPAGGDALPLPGLPATPGGAPSGAPPATGKPAAGRVEYTPEFEEFWRAYGARGTKRAAAVQWAKALTRAPHDVIMAAVGPYVASTPEVRYRKHAERWLRDDGWLSTVAPPTPAGGTQFRNVAEASYYDTRI